MLYSEYLRDDACVIFLLHGVIRKQVHYVRNYTRKHLPLEEFIVLLDDLGKNGNPVSMDQVLESCVYGATLPKRSFAITFDDGFENNASVAAPALIDFNIPATFYVTTEFINEGARSWTDLIESALETVQDLTIKGIAPHLDGKFIHSTDKRNLMNNIRHYVKGSSDIDPYKFAEKIIKECGLSEAPFDPSLDGKLSWQQVKWLAEHPLFTVGGHGHTHRILAYLSTQELEQEIKTSLRLLREATGLDTRHYSYPEGLVNCYSEKVILNLKSQGIRCSPSAEHGWNKRGDDPFRLNRIFVL
jgi:peptidoglycan/xylan/chitin deacetylase (PgdA/CDA1 family)